MRKNRRLSLSISDAGWGEFMRQLEYKATWYGRLVSKISLYFPSSQMCHDCGFKNAEVKNLAVREWTCPNCGETRERDENAALNIRREALVAAGIADTLNARREYVGPASAGNVR
jgi:putative transposase